MQQVKKLRQNHLKISHVKTQALLDMIVGMTLQLIL